MKAKTILRVYYWIILATGLIYAIRTFYVNWIEDKTYLKQHGKKLLRSLPLPSVFIDIIIFSIIAAAFIWTIDLKKQLSSKDKEAQHYIDTILILTFLFILPFIFFDYKLLQLIYSSTRNYLLIQPNTKW
jgi:hypothetical protein